MRVPASQRDEWLTRIGLDGESITTKDPRISIMHFTPDNLAASIEGVGLCARTVVRPAPDAKPTQSNSRMEQASRGAYARELRALAENKALSALLTEARASLHKLGLKVTDQRERLQELRSTKKAAKPKEQEDAKPPTWTFVDYHILDGLKTEFVRSLCGLSSLEHLEVSSHDCTAVFSLYVPFIMQGVRMIQQ